LKIQVHFVMLVATGSLFAIGVGLFIYDFFRHAPRFEVEPDAAAARAPNGEPILSPP
jgi:nitric oxide reductase subunit B